MTKRHNWTEEELNIVRRDYNGHNDSAIKIANGLSISFNAVKSKIATLGICHNTNRKPWTLKEEVLLRDLITSYCPRTVAKKMGRSENSVVVRVKRLHLSRRARDGWFTKAEVCEILGVDHHWVQNRINQGELKASWHNGSKPEKNGGACWHILIFDLRQFIVEHSIELTGRNVDLSTILYIIGV